MSGGRHHPLALLVPILFAWAVQADAHCAEPLKLTLKSKVTVSGDVVTVGDLAVIEGAAEAKARLEKVIVGASPLPGEARGISAGYVKMRLRREGLDLDGVTVEGDEVRVTRGGEARPHCQGLDEQHEPAMRRGEAVEVVVRVGAIALRVSAKVVEEMGDGAVMVRIDPTQAVLRATIIGARLCEVKMDDRE